ncbi:MAG: hypothetical protein Q9210_006238 [Variospora velana]
MVSECVPVVDLVGVIFQICDDYVNLHDTGYGQGKGSYEDVTEGIFSIPVIHGISARHDDQLLLNVLRRKATDDAVKQQSVRYLRDCGSFAYTREVIAQLHWKAMLLVKDLEQKHEGNFGGPLRAIIDGIVKATLSGGDDQAMGEVAKTTSSTLLADGNTQTYAVSQPTVQHSEMMAML